MTIARPFTPNIFRIDKHAVIVDRNGNKISIDGHDNQTLILRTDSDSNGHSCAHTMPLDMAAAEHLRDELTARIKAAHDWEAADRRDT